MQWKNVRRTLGLDEGGPLRAAFDDLVAALGLDRLRPGPVESRVAFTIALVTLAAKMSKADGVSSPIEEQVLEHLFDVPENERPHLKRVFDLASQDVAGFEIYAGRMAKLLADEPELKISVLECLFHVASADGILHPGEDAFVARVAGIFEVPDADYKTVRRAFVHDPDNPYDVLGVSSKASDEAIKTHYRRLVRENHPDALVAKGVPQEFLAASGRRLAAINAAYENILAERGRSVPQSLERAP
jgi:DnaJ like chaperone protein